MERAEITRKDARIILIFILTLILAGVATSCKKEEPQKCMECTEYISYKFGGIEYNQQPSNDYKEVWLENSEAFITYQYKQRELNYHTFEYFGRDTNVFGEKIVNRFCR